MRASSPVLEVSPAVREPVCLRVDTKGKRRSPFSHYLSLLGVEGQADEGGGCKVGVSNPPQELWLWVLAGFTQSVRSGSCPPSPPHREAFLWCSGKSVLCVQRGLGLHEQVREVRAGSRTSDSGAQPGGLLQGAVPEQTRSWGLAGIPVSGCSVARPVSISQPLRPNPLDTG